jgi:hypothetical protein
LLFGGKPFWQNMCWKEKQKVIKIILNLIAFKALKNPIDGINEYLSMVYFEAKQRGYNFNKEKKIGSLSHKL